MRRAAVITAALAAMLGSSAASAQTPPPAPPPPVPDYGANLERFDYPYPVHWFDARSQSGPVRMAYLDVAPMAPAKNLTVVLLHGKNFCAATWGDTIATLSAHGYRVIAPDQIGFCKSSKPEGYQYSFAALATLTAELLAHVDAGRVVMVGHSTGGMLGIQFALLYPRQLRALMLVNPLGLNDTIAEGVPYADLDVLRGEESLVTAARIKAYQQHTYYHGNWRPAYDRWVAMLAGEYASADGDVVRDAQARLSDMIQTQPTATLLDRVRVPVTLLIGQLDTTAFRAATAPEALRPQIHTVPQAAETAVHRFPDARLVRLPGLGHAPQVEDPARFQAALLEALDRNRDAP